MAGGKNDAAGGFGVVVGRDAVVEPAVGVEVYIVSHLSPQERVDGLVRGLAGDVPEGDIDGADDGRGDAACADRSVSAPELVPERLDVGWIFADEGVACG